MPFDTTRPVKILIIFMKCVGMWNFEENSCNKYYITYSWILHSLFTFLFILAMYINIGLAGSLEEFADALYMTLTETALLVKVFNILRQSKKAVEFIKIIESSYDGCPTSLKEEALAVRLQNGFCKLRNAHIGGSLTVLALAFISSLLDENYQLPFPCWMPFEYRNSKNFYYAYCFVVMGMVVTAVSNFTMDLFQSYLLFQISVFYKLLAVRLGNFGFSCDHDCNEQLEQIRNFHSLIERWVILKSFHMVAVV